MFDFREYRDGIFAFDSGYVRPLLAAVHMIVERGRVAFVDTGTNASLPTVLEALARVGLGPEAVDYVILTHIHLDHAGGAGAMMQAFPRAKLVVHPRGARHMAAPAKLIAGVTEVYGAEYVAKMYGEILPVPAARIIEAGHGDSVSLAGRELVFLDTPGHARHHICIVDRRAKAIFTGDMFGLAYPQAKIGGEQFVFPTTTPTQFEPEAMRQSMALLLAERPRAMYLTHYGELREVELQGAALLRHLDAFEAIARREQAAGKDGRKARIRAGLAAYVLAEMAALGSKQTTDDWLDFWATDLELNAQGLDIWLDSLTQ